MTRTFSALPPLIWRLPVLKPPARRRSRIETVAEHLKQRGHISEGSALIEYGRFRLADVIHRLRNERQDLLPKGKEIVTIHKVDTKGAPYGEYHLVETHAAASQRRVAKARQMVEAVRREQFSTPERRVAHRDELSFLGSLGPIGG